MNNFSPFFLFQLLSSMILFHNTTSFLCDMVSTRGLKNLAPVSSPPALRAVLSLASLWLAHNLSWSRINSSFIVNHSDSVTLPFCYTVIILYIHHDFYMALTCKLSCSVYLHNTSKIWPPILWPNDKTCHMSPSLVPLQLESLLLGHTSSESFKMLLTSWSSLFASSTAHLLCAILPLLPVSTSLPHLHELITKCPSL